STPWRIVGAVDGTMLTYDPAAPTGAPSTIGNGQLATFWSDAPFIVRSQDDAHPFYMSGHMTGCSYVGGCGGSPGPLHNGDPEVVNVVPAKQYQSDYVFFADPTYEETSLVFVRAKGSGGFADVSLDCAGTLSGWKPLGKSGEYE